ncbi:unnamed protein product [Arabidopsis thaliana]|uniref:At2g35280-like TPR domain-containing protein n=2 Tax=Arabidopsis thaliana TaxID=3702 RepID=A0A654EQL9_ARATH|nr:F-box protein [Arabidopsis thaliana]AEE35642.1 F-box protein [Arabidopsis thaliana]VYS51058.1 unnamed protein product [Arabidopsis thaliana]|eukprot:NP_001154471.1 F-box protein [Arabidopsis thaliana]
MVNLGALNDEDKRKCANMFQIHLVINVLSSSLSEFRNLQLVSKSFKRISNDRYILQRLSLNKIPLLPWRNRKKFHNFFKRCRKSGNLEAIYRKGLVDYFHRDSHERQRDRGLKHIAKTANNGNQEAQYVYGLILICLGGKTKQNGFKILSSLRKPLMLSNTIKEMEKHRTHIRNMWWWGEPMMRHLQKSYVRENCNCDGRTEIFPNYCFRHRFGEDDDMLTSSACEICLCHHEVKLFFANIKE